MGMVANSENLNDGVLTSRSEKENGRQTVLVYVSPSRTLLELSLWIHGLQACHIPVIDTSGRVVGVVTPLDILNVIERNQTDFVRSLLSIGAFEVARPAPLLTVDYPVEEVVLRVLDDRCRCGVVLDSSGQPVAVISCYDALKLALGVEEVFKSLAETPVDAVVGKTKVLPFETTVRQAVTALVSYSGEPLVVEQTDFAVTSRSVLSSILSPRTIPKLLKKGEEILDSYLVYENDALVRLPVVSNDRSLAEVTRFVADAKVDILRTENGSYVTISNIIELVRNRLSSLVSS